MRLEPVKNLKWCFLNFLSDSWLETIPLALSRSVMKSKKIYETLILGDQQKKSKKIYQPHRRTPLRCLQPFFVIQYPLPTHRDVKNNDNVML